ncbi:MAG: rod shape-determining protein MreC [Nocardioides sp.]
MTWLRRPARARLLAFVLATLSLMALDRQQFSADDPTQGSVLDPARRAVGEFFAPLSAGTNAAIRPVRSLPRLARTNGELRSQVASLESDNAELRRKVASADLDRNRLSAYDALTHVAATSGRAMVPARVIATGSAGGFAQVVTIDAGARAGVRSDLTVINRDGLVGRVLRTTTTTATVLLIADADSGVGARLGSNSELGLLRGHGSADEAARLDLELLDDVVVPERDDIVFTWGSDGGAPYVGGVPIGRVTKVFHTPRDTTKQAIVEPFVDFTSLDLVGVVVPSGTTSDRALIEADGTLR